MSFSTLLMAAGTVISAIGTIASANAQAAAAEYNAKIQQQNADTARQQASADAQDARRESARRLGRIRASFATNGIDPQAGTAMTVYEDQAAEDLLEQRRIYTQGAQRATGYENQRNLDKMQAKSVKTAGYIGAAASIVSGVGNIVRLQ